MKWYHTATCAIAVGLFLWFSYTRVSDPATWNAVATSQRSSNLVDGWLPLSEGMPFVAASQGGNCFIGWLYSTGSVELLSVSFAILKTCTFLIWSVIFFRLTSPSRALLGTIAIIAASFFEIDGLTVMSLGQFFVAVMFLILACQLREQRIAWKNASLLGWSQMILLMIVWANVDASVFSGLALLSLLPVSRAIEVGRKCLHDHEFQHRIWLFQICFLATAISPDGIESWKTLFNLDSFLRPLGGWQPSTMAGFNGAIVGLFWLFWTFAKRNQNNRFTFFDATSLLLTVGVACSQSLVAWFAPVICIAILQSFPIVQSRPDRDARQDSLQFAFTLLSGLVLWIGFCFSPFGNQILGGNQRSHLSGSHFPTELKTQLNRLQNPTVWCPLAWSDWLAIDNQIKIYMNRDQWRFPATVIREHRSMFLGDGWQHLADKYDIDAMAIDKKRQTEFLPQFRRAPGDWRIAFEDQNSMLLQRTHP